MTDATVPVTAIVTAYDRPIQVVETLQHIRDCRPAPQEVLVHVDAGQAGCRTAVTASGLADRVFTSVSRVGPGGGRNLLMREARCEIVASFDDDSWPLDLDYFARVTALFVRHPEAAVVSARVFERGQAPAEVADGAEWRADFGGGGCAYRREAFLSTGGYVPLATAYGMEEVDLALRLSAAGRKVLHSPWLRVRHDSDLSHHSRPDVTEASLRNIALLAYLRYPVSLWWLGLLQYLNRIQWLVRHGRLAGVVSGMTSVPRYLHAHRVHRQPLPAAAIHRYLALRRRPEPAEITP